MSEEQYHSASHCKYLIQYHIIWCPKFRFSVLKGNVEDTLKQILQKICDDYNYHIKALEVMPDHIHIFIDVPQTVVFFATPNYQKMQNVFQKVAAGNSSRL